MIVSALAFKPAPVLLSIGSPYTAMNTSEPLYLVPSRRRLLALVSESEESGLFDGSAWLFSEDNSLQS
ncbi:hypothetical protein BD779DRAFT_1576980 [Infundibulicybe gibba]|nr:hypothetical protein BD779DRAFT_1576980 [Infundibulicybe gibba]